MRKERLRRFWRAAHVLHLLWWEHFKGLCKELAVLWGTLKAFTVVGVLWGRHHICSALVHLRGSCLLYGASSSAVCVCGPESALRPPLCHRSAGLLVNFTLVAVNQLSYHTFQVAVMFVSL